MSSLFLNSFCCNPPPQKKKHMLFRLLQQIIYIAIYEQHMIFQGLRQVWKNTLFFDFFDFLPGIVFKGNWLQRWSAMLVCVYIQTSPPNNHKTLSPCPMKTDRTLKKVAGIQRPYLRPDQNEAIYQNIK